MFYEVMILMSKLKNFLIVCFVKVYGNDYYFNYE